MNKKNYLAIFAKSFNWAGFFLPKKVYEDSAKLYAFCRTLDDIADEKTDLDSKIKRFNEMRNFLKKSSMILIEYFCWNDTFSYFCISKNLFFGGVFLKISINV